MALISNVSGTLTGITFMDPLNNRELPNDNKLYPYNPCNPPYWYPRQIPEYCHNRNNVDLPHPLSTAAPSPPQKPLPFEPPPLPIFEPIPVPMPVPVPLNPFLPVQQPGFMPPSPMIPQQIGMVPGLPGIVSQDGGINIMPFSDAYSDMLEKHKNKVIRKKFKKIIRNLNY